MQKQTVTSDHMLILCTSQKDNDSTAMMLLRYKKTGESILFQKGSAVWEKPSNKHFNLDENLNPITKKVADNTYARALAIGLLKAFLKEKKEKYSAIDCQKNNDTIINCALEKLKL